MEWNLPIKYNVGDLIDMGIIGSWEIKTIEDVNNITYVRLIPSIDGEKYLNCTIYMNIENMKKYVSMYKKSK